MRGLGRMASANRIQQSVDVGKVHTTCHISAHKVREEKEHHPRSFLGRASRMDNGELPEHTLGCTAQRDVFFHRQHTGKATDILHARLCNSPDGIQDIYKVRTRSSTSRPTILHAYVPLASLPSTQQIVGQSSAEFATSTRFGPRHSYKSNLLQKLLCMNPHLSSLQETSMPLNHGLSG